MFFKILFISLEGLNCLMMVLVKIYKINVLKVYVAAYLNSLH